MKKLISSSNKKSQEPVSWARKIFEHTQDLNQIGNQKTFYTHQRTTRKSDIKPGLEGLFGSLNHGIQKPQRMIIKSGSVVLHKINLNPECAEYILGNHELADVQLDNPKISPFHAKIFSAGGHFFVEDLGSKTGTFINNRKLSPEKAIELDNHTVLRVDGFEIDFDLNENDLPEVKANHSFARNQEHDDFLLSQLIKDRQQVKSWTVYETELNVIGIVNETASVKTFRLASQQPLLFHYQPGQYVTLFVYIYGRVARRSYSIASTPSRPHVIEITVKRMPSGLVSNWLCDNIKVGDQLRIKGPFGRFSCINYPSRKILLLAAGSGIVPIMSKIRWIADTGARVDVKLLMSFKQAADIIFRKELELIAANHKNIKICLTLTGKKKHKKTSGYHAGRIDQNILQRFVPDFLQRHIFLCGPEEYMAQVQDILYRAGFPENKLHCESFTYAEKLSQNKKQQLKQKILKTKGKYQITFEKSGLSIKTDGKDNILEIAEAFDILIDNDCRQGSCGVCMARCISGQINMTEQAEIDVRDKEAGWVYTCSAYPGTNVTLDL